MKTVSADRPISGRSTKRSTTTAINASAATAPAIASGRPSHDRPDLIDTDAHCLGRDRVVSECAER
jgi:hypothetical protein